MHVKFENLFYLFGIGHWLKVFETEITTTMLIIYSLQMRDKHKYLITLHSRMIVHLSSKVKIAHNRHSVRLL